MMSGDVTEPFLGGFDAAKPIKSLMHGVKDAIINTCFVNVKTFCSNFEIPWELLRPLIDV